MKTKYWKLKVLVAAALFVLMLISLSVASPDELAKVQSAIQARGAGWSVGESWVTRLDPEERHRLLGEITMGQTPWDQSKSMPFALEAAPAAIDWRNKDGYNWITPIRDQSGCRSCVAFGSVATLEALVRIEQKDPTMNINLSEMHLFNCGGGGCSFGWYNSAACSYFRDNGTPDEACWPYQPVNRSCNNTCPDWQSRTYKITDYSRISGIEACKTHTAIAPILVSFKVYSDFYYYAGGIYERTSGSYEGGHAVSIVGYDTTGPVDYWIVKNSWGNSWGENGYFRIKMGECNIENRSSYWMAGAILPSQPPEPPGFNAIAPIVSLLLN